MSDVFQEVDEELRRDKAAELWKRYGNYVLGAAIAIVVGTAGYVVWRDYTHRQATAHSSAFFTAALTAPSDPPTAIAAFDALARDSSGAYAALARLREAALKADDREAAAATYRSIVEDGSVPQELRDIARLLASIQSAEKSAPAEVEAQLQTLRADSSPWRHSATELAALAALRVGETAKARELFVRISDDPAAPTAMRGRAAEMIASLGS